ncbi:AAA family ATPase [Actinosynnema sp. NPDC047251]|uniref:Transcriptional regulator, LuxR family n=1 Tax=Saccharothrix espanaensis (strain ATCC 51144 / DSM 44229 / JCM 9112 / NBRC 15066 / NRRL 15764) TaxID=1179773 RepID=K0JPB5_SACES|nr:helix-turn-helix transcriptional regulator [Saccharothrix espanaensis]CCH28460.1 Transcriptional regulator, LuxR family [Saccharothrix espanaensis DSM 44229]
MLHGRSSALARVDGLLADARAGRSGVLVVRGEAGIGKSALLDHIVADGFRVLRGVAVESESGLPFAGLNLLLGRVVDRADRLPPNQAAALRAALGLAPADGVDRYLVGLAVLTLLADLAEQGPVLCLVDDAHWLDAGSSDALVFAARRLEAEGVVVIFAARDLHAPPFPAPGLPELRLTALSTEDSAALLDEHAADLPRYVRDQIAVEARGNPLALLELPAAQREGHLPAAHAYRVGALPTHSRIQQTFADRIGALPAGTRDLLLVAAADDTGDPGVVFKAAAALGAGVADLEEAERRQLLRTDDGRLTFRHPLIRAAAYQSAPLVRRLAVHRALAGALGDEFRRAWHLAAATTAPDEEVAAALARSAEDVRGRGGSVAVTAAYQRAAELTPDAAQRGRRFTAAAAAAAEAGQFDRAGVLADQAAELVGELLEHVRVFQIRAELASEQGRSAEAAATLARAAQCAAHADRELAGELLFSAALSAWTARDHDAVRTIAEQSAGLPNEAEVRAVARAALGLEGTDVAGALAAIRELLAADLPGRHGNAVVSWWNLIVGDDEAAQDSAVTLERECRASGALGVLPRALAYLARVRLHQGRFHDACATAEEGLRLADDIGQVFSVGYLHSVLSELAAIEGAEQRCRELVANLTGGPPLSIRGQCALALLDLGLGRYDSVLERLADVAAGAHRLYAIGSLPDIVEAAVRTGKADVARDAADWYDEWAQTTGQLWSRAVAARCRALLTDEERWFAEAVELHRTSGRPFERARTELLYGEWLRRERRRGDARAHLRSALDAFDRLGAAPWAARARTELRATGESHTQPGPDPLSALTPQELQVVRMAAEGLSNRDIGAQLFLSPRTVGYHLYKAYPKLGVASRVELGRLDLSG